MLRGCTFVLIWALAALAGFTRTSRAEDSETGLSQADERIFYRELHLQSDAFYEEFKVHMPHMSRSQWRESMNYAALKMQQVSEFRGALKRSARIAALPLFVTFLLTSVLIPGTNLWYQNQFGDSPTLDWIVGAIIAFPFGPFVIGGALYFRHRSFGRQMRDVLGMDSLDSLVKLRDELLGFDLRTRLLSSSFDAIDEAQTTRRMDLEILSRRNGRAPAPGTVTVAELEELVRSTGDRGAAYLDATYVKQAKRVVYPQLLLAYIQDDASLTARLSRRLRASIDALPAGRAAQSRAFLVSIQQALQELDAQDESLARASGALKPKLDRQERGLLKTFVKNHITSSADFNWQILSQELSYLHALSKGQDPDILHLSRTLDNELRRRRKLVREIDELSMSSYPTLDAFRARSCASSLGTLLGN
jgi:hypothetical protein